ncbi:MAG TPA: CDP-alcohol phosphatidyltransferase family protein [Polyangia bacterium]|nr:CDP-alcohol phosphatidyltransferase family protein [Polyangia bacterium]
MLAEVRDLYRHSRKPHDILWNTYVSRPMAAFVLHFLRRTPLTPNQVTFASLLVALGGDVAMVFWQGRWGLLAAALILQASYVLDCVDGQLARLKDLATPVGAHLDFLMDELKAYALLAAVSARLWLASPERDVRWLLLGLGGLGVLASAISLTTFMRRPEYAPPPPKTGFAPPPPVPRSPVAFVGWAVTRAARFIAHYPSYLLLVALVDRIDLYFFPYLGVHALYLVRSMAQIMWKLGRPRMPA